MRRLKVALLGLSGVGVDYLTAIRSDQRFDLLSIADTDPEITRRHTEGGATPVYGDYRSLIVEAGRVPVERDTLYEIVKRETPGVADED